MRLRTRISVFSVLIAVSSTAVAVAAPTPADASPRQLNVTAWTAVSCVGGCSQAGYFDDPTTGTRRPRLQISQGVGNWIVDELGGGPGVNAQYNALSCPQPAGCLAVGTATTASGSTPIVNAGVPLKTKGVSSGANGVSCPTPEFCMTVGWYRNSAGVTKTLTEVADPYFWRIVASPNSGSLSMMLTAVSCSSSSFCIAVGYRSGPGIADQPYAIQWDGLSWFPTPLPSVDASHAIRLTGVSCSALTFCMAVGSERGATTGTIEWRWESTAWTPLQAQTHIGVQPSNFEFNAVSCGAADVCTAVGAERGAANVALVAVWDGHSWTRRPMPDPRPADVLYATACSTVACSVGGSRSLSVNVTPIGALYSVPAVPGIGSMPMMTSATRGDGWINVEWVAPLVAGPDPILGYRLTTFVGGLPGPNFDVGPAARSVTVPENATSENGFLYALTSTGVIGPSLDPTLFFGPPVTGPVNISTDWEPSELARLQQSAAYFSVSTAQLQHDAVGVLAYILSLSPPSAPTPISTQVVDAGPSTVTSAWPVTDQPVLVGVTNQYALTPGQTQRFAAQLVGYLLSLGGH